MFRATAILASFVGASAFAPAPRMAARSALSMSFKDEIGALPPVGYWDPLGTAVLLSATITHMKFLLFYKIEIVIVAMVHHMQTTAIHDKHLTCSTFVLASFPTLS